MSKSLPISIFDVIGPIMVGPSSSHTAGAVRLGMMGRMLLGCTPIKALVELHGSFAETGKGHGTDKAIIAGLLGLVPQDPRLRDSLSIAGDSGLIYKFEEVDLGEDAHPNSCRITISDNTNSVCYVGCSVGGGLIEITELEGFPVSFTGELDCLIVIANDQPGTTSLITHWLYDHQVNIAYMTVDRQQKGGSAIITVQTDQQIPDNLVSELDAFPWTLWARVIKKLED